MKNISRLPWFVCNNSLKSFSSSSFDRLSCTGSWSGGAGTASTVGPGRLWRLFTGAEIFSLLFASFPVCFEFLSELSELSEEFADDCCLEDWLCSLLDSEAEAVAELLDFSELTEFSLLVLVLCELFDELAWLLCELFEELLELDFCELLLFELDILELLIFFDDLDDWVDLEDFPLLAVSLLLVFLCTFVRLINFQWYR